MKPIYEEQKCLTAPNHQNTMLYCSSLKFGHSLAFHYQTSTLICQIRSLWAWEGDGTFILGLETFYVKMKCEGSQILVMFTLIIGGVL